MKPLQVWLPALNSTLSDPAWSRDAQRALDAWNGETTVWLLPWLDRKAVWREGPGRRALAIPAEHLDRIDVYHVGENGYAFGPASTSRFPESRIGRLLEGWLDADVLAGVRAYSPPPTVDFEIPKISARGVEYCLIALRPQPRGMLPISEIDEAARIVWTRWPPEGRHFQTVSPDQESAEMFGPFERSEENSSVAVSKGGNRTLFAFTRWPGALGQIIPNADGIDLFYQRQLMAAIARRSAQDAAWSRVQATNLGRAYVSNGKATRMSAWFCPTRLGDGDEALCFKAEDLGFKARHPSELLARAEFRRRMAEQVDIRRVWGPLGLFWALLLEQLEEYKRFGICERCDRIIRGERLKRFCGRNDNRDCYADRRKLDQRRSRQQRTKKECS